MRKLAIILISLMFFATACSDGDDALGFDPNVSAGTMQEVTVVGYHGKTNVSLVELWTTVGSDYKIDVETVPLAGNPKAPAACNGSAELSEEDYQDVVAAVAAVGPMTYESSSQEDCDTMDHKYCLDVLYLDVSGEEASFSIDIIAIDPIVSDLTSLVGELSGAYVPECFDDNDLEEDDDDDNDDDDGADSDIVVYDVPIINPRDIPRPTRVKP